MIPARAAAAALAVLVLLLPVAPAAAAPAVAVTEPEEAGGADVARVGVGAVSVSALSCRQVGGAWFFEDGRYFGTVGESEFDTAVFAGEGSARLQGDRCAFHGRGAIFGNR